MNPRLSNLFLFLSILPLPVAAGEGTVLYRLEKGSTLFDDCPICGRPPIVLALEGTFLLTLENIGDVTDWYGVDSIDFRTTGGQDYRVSGSGKYLTRLGAGGIIAQNSLSLEVEVNGEAGIKLESGEAPTGVGFPAIDINVDEQTSSMVRVFRIHLVASAVEGVPYELLPGSVFVDDCRDCDRVTISRPLTGGFLLSQIDENPLFTTYRLYGVEFQNAESDIGITGWGTFSLGGEVALLQEMDLNAAVSVGATTRSPVILSSGGKVVINRRLPEIEIQLNEKDPPDLLHIATVHLVARPRAVLSPPYRRGDSNGDGRIDVSDAVHVLFWLFAAGREPGCLDAADSDGNGKSKVTDAVFLLNYLFLGGAAPPEPGPAACGQVTKEPLGCQRYGSCAVTG